MLEIQDKIDNGDYNLDLNLDEVDKKSEDLFFATEIETNYIDIRAHKEN